MRVGFYAPLKPPHHPVPSGDRRMARLLMRALVAAGHEVELMSSLRTWCLTPEALPAARDAAQAAAARLARMLPARPRAEAIGVWFTYHLYYRAPDWIGPAVADALGIPYVVAEASSAGKRLTGPWAEGERAARAALARASAVLSINPADDAGVLEHVDRPDRLFRLVPFLDLAAEPQPAADRAALATRFAIPVEEPWLLAVAMMREGDKLASYRLLGESLALIADLRWRLVVAGDGPAREAVAAALGPRAHLLGACPPELLQALYAASDLIVWPAVNEAFGMALLEARAAGLPVVAGDQGGVATIVDHGRSGLVVAPLTPEAFAAAVRRLLLDPAERRRMAAFARETTGAKHGLGAAAATVSAALAYAAAHRRPLQPAIVTTDPKGLAAR
jgi:glycosyltransferase involved in cell wall biosynthesis